MTAQTGTPAEESSSDPLEGVVLAGLLLAGWLLLIVVCAPLLLPFLVKAVTAWWAPTKRWYWVTYSWWWVAVTLGIVLVAALLTFETVLLATWVQSGGFELARSSTDPVAAFRDALLPWFLVNVAAGALLIPAVWSWERRKVASRVRKRLIPDVVRQERIETAQKQALDLSSANRIGVQIDAVTRTITGTKIDSLTAPHKIGEKQYAIGMINKNTLAGVAERVADQSRVPDWVSEDGKFLQMPTKAGNCRLMLFSESGTGKTVLLMSAILAAMLMGWKVIFIDAKGVPKDARELAKLVEIYGGTAVISGAGKKAQTRWNLFHGSAEDITAKLMRLQPPPSGANQYYLTEIRAVLQALQHMGPVQSLQDLQERADKPGQWARDRFDHRMLNEVVEPKTGQTAVQRAVASVAQTLREFEEWIDPDGWSFDAPEADVTICPLIPVDPTQAALGDLLLLELRAYLKRRLSVEDYSPVLVIVDEFPQLVTPGNDPADLAARLYETMRSAGGGLVLAAQNPAGLSLDSEMRDRALTSGAAVMFGRQKKPDELCELAGTEIRLEASGAAAGDELRSGRAQHTYRIKPDDVRQASGGQFWIVQGGAHAGFRSLPNAAVDATATPDTAPVSDETTAGSEPNQETEGPNA